MKNLQILAKTIRLKYYTFTNLIFPVQQVISNIRKCKRILNRFELAKPCLRIFVTVKGKLSEKEKCFRNFNYKVTRQLLTLMLFKYQLLKMLRPLL